MVINVRAPKHVFCKLIASGQAIPVQPDRQVELTIVRLALW